MLVRVRLVEVLDQRLVVDAAHELGELLLREFQLGVQLAQELDRSLGFVQARALERRADPGDDRVRERPPRVLARVERDDLAEHFDRLLLPVPLGLLLPRVGEVRPRELHLLGELLVGLGDAGRGLRELPVVEGVSMETLRARGLAEFGVKLVAARRGGVDRTHAPLALGGLRVRGQVDLLLERRRIHLDAGEVRLPQQRDEVVVGDRSSAHHAQRVEQGLQFLPRSVRRKSERADSILIEGEREMLLARGAQILRFRRGASRGRDDRLVVEPDLGGGEAQGPAAVLLEQLDQRVENLLAGLQHDRVVGPVEPADLEGPRELAEPAAACLRRGRELAGAGLLQMGALGCEADGRTPGDPAKAPARVDAAGTRQPMKPGVAAAPFVALSAAGGRIWSPKPGNRAAHLGPVRDRELSPLPLTRAAPIS